MQQLIPSQESSTLLARFRRLYVVALALAGVSFALQIAGFSTQGWMIFQMDDDQGTDTNVKLGLWAMTMCIDDNCEPVESEKSKEFIINTAMLEYQVETCIALAFLLLAIVFHIGGRRSPVFHVRMRGYVLGLALLTLLSGILAMVPAIKIGDDTRKAASLMKMMTGSNPFKFPYSLFLSGLGGLLACVLSLAYAVGLKPWRDDSDAPPFYSMEEESCPPAAHGDVTSASTYPPPPYVEAVAPHEEVGFQPKY